MIATSVCFSGSVSYVTLWLTQEELSKTERKNRDEFRKLMEADVALGTLTAKTNWRDYCIKVIKFNLTFFSLFLFFGEQYVVAAILLKSV